MLRTDPKWTKAEIREYLLKVYGVRIARIATYIAAGAWRPRAGMPPLRERAAATRAHRAPPPQASSSA